jgi:hypothetical protein
VITLGDRTTMEAPVFTDGAWGVTGITLRPEGA